MINAALNLIPSAAGQGRPQIIPAVVAPNTARTPLPTSFNDPLYVTSPMNDDNFWKILDWTVDHGETLPAAGAAAALFYDSNGSLRVVWWDGVYTAPSLSTVFGTAKAASGTATLTWTSSGASGILTISLPGATGTVQGLVTPASFATGPTAFHIVLCVPDGSGGVSVQAYTEGAVAITGTGTITYLIWGS